MGRKPDPKPRRATVIRYALPDGTRCAKGTPGAVRIKTQTDSYYVELPNPAKGPRGRDRIPLETTGLAVAWARMAEVLRRREKEALGLLDESSRQLARPIAEHLEDWLAAVAAGDVTAKRVAMLRTRVTNLIEAAGWSRIGEIRVSSCQRGLALLRASVKGRGGEGMSARTRNHYLGHARQFAAWLVADRRLPSDPLATLKAANVEADSRHDRRSPGDEEVRVLFDRLAGTLGGPAPDRLGMSGPCRALGYQVCMCSGLRANELRSLTPDSFDHASGDVRLKAKRAKSRRRTAQALPRWLLLKLADWFAAGGAAWDRFPEHWPGRLLQDDLADARAAWLADAAADPAESARRERSTVCVYEAPGPDGSLFWDFHALRHWYITQIAAQDGISPSTLQSLSRHSDPKLTLEVYAKARETGRRAAADRVVLPGQGP